MVTYASNGHTLKAVLQRDTQSPWGLPCHFRWTLEMWLDTNPPNPPTYPLFSDYMQLRIWRNNTQLTFPGWQGYGTSYAPGIRSPWFAFQATDQCQADNSGTREYDGYTLYLFHNAYIQDPQPFGPVDCRG